MHPRRSHSTGEANGRVSRPDWNQGKSKYMGYLGCLKKTPFRVFSEHSWARVNKISQMTLFLSFLIFSLLSYIEIYREYSETAFNGATADRGPKKLYLFYRGKTMAKLTFNSWSVFFFRNIKRSASVHYLYGVIFYYFRKTRRFRPLSLLK